MASPAALPPFEAQDRPYANVMLKRSCGLALQKSATSEEPQDYSLAFKGFTVPFNCESDYIAVADLFVEFVAPHSDSPNRNLLHGFFDRNAVRAVRVETLTTSETKVAIQFLAFKAPKDITNKSLYQDVRVTAASTDDGVVTLSATFPMNTSAEKVRFASAFAKNRLRDFYAKGVTVHITTLAECIPRPGVEAEADAEVAVQSETEESETDEEEQEVEAVESETGEEQEQEQEEEEEEESTTGREHLQEVSDVLFDLKETMSDDAFVRLSNSLKRAHDQMF
jgi:hypothetical protein